MLDGTRKALLAAGGCAGALVLAGLAAYKLPFAHNRDSAILAGFRSLIANTRIFELAIWIGGVAKPLTYVAAAVVLAAVAALRHRPRLALSVPAAMAGATGSAELLKQLGSVRHSSALGPFQQITVPSWPSGHSTSALMVALCGVVVAPAALRRLVAVVGVGGSLAVAYAMAILGRHFPSDLFGGFLLAGLWTALLLASPWRDREPAASTALASPSRGDRVRRAASTAAAALAALLIAVCLLAASQASVHRGSLIAGAAVIALLATAITTTLLAMLGELRAPPALASRLAVAFAPRSNAGR
jgi:membrane-associated phospholipid phosphatase